MKVKGLRVIFIKTLISFYSLKFEMMFYLKMMHHCWCMISPYGFFLLLMLFFLDIKMMYDLLGDADLITLRWKSF